MEETCSKLNSTQKIVVNLLQQVVTECTDRVPATQPCTVASTTGYRVYRPGTGYTAFVQLTRPPTGYRVIRPSPFNSVDSGAGRQLVSTRYGFNRLVTESTDRPHSLLHINQLQNLPITNQHQESPTQRSSTSWPLLISSLFTGLRLLQLVTELTNRLPAIQFSLSSFASHQLVTESTNLLSCAITVLPLFNTGYRGPEPTSRPTWGSPS